ncbi:uncharacterized protein LOC143301301 isoform X2 [Babylonia areolata]|uniref:uncharacterized protein LOC143301301 isoform X2 n=1 Tax=Babylonia areolata TaxID=304850 RepID=UPI003FD54057
MQRLAVSFLASLFVTLLLVSTVLASPVLDEGSVRTRRSSSDQRIAELQALLALTGGSGRVAHGQFDPLRLGKKKRDYGDEQRYQLLRSLIERAADNNVVQN